MAINTTAAGPTTGRPGFDIFGRPLPGIGPQPTPAPAPAPAPLPSMAALSASTLPPQPFQSSGAGGGYDPTNPAMTAPMSVSTPQYQTGANGTQVQGSGALTTGAYEQQQQSQLDTQLKSAQMQQAANLQAQAEARRLGYLSTITGQQSPQVAGQVGPAADENAARAAAFARAKEQSGQTALASLKALQDVMAETGKTGSSIEAQGVQNIIGGGEGAINNFTRTQLMQDLNRAADVADRNQQNAITQRGQNLSLIPSLMGLITATGGVY